MNFQDFSVIYAVRYSLKVKKLPTKHETVGISGFTLQTKWQAFWESTKVNLILYIFKGKYIFN